MNWEIKEAYSVAVALQHGGTLKQPGSSFQYLVVEGILAHYFGDVAPAQTAVGDFCQAAGEVMAARPSV